MKHEHYKALLYFITITIGITIGIQLYWNIQNYNTNKQRLINEVQISLDNSVEAYYADFVKTDIFTYTDSSFTDYESVGKKMGDFINKLDLKQIYSETDTSYNKAKVSTIKFIENSDSLHKHNFNILDGKMSDTTIILSSVNINEVRGIPSIKAKAISDSISNLFGLFNKLTISINQDSISFKNMDSLLKKELERKKIDVAFGLNHYKSDTIYDSYKVEQQKDLHLSTFSKSTYLPTNQKLQLQYTNPTKSILKRSFTGIILSLLLSACIIACLFYLLHIINKQKELAEIKNDLISNITHEFKTPIATVSTAIEGIKNFNETNDSEKTNKYLDISNQQLKKLHAMVEKLLETATLDSDKLIINTEEIDLVLVLKNLVEKYQMLSPGKTISFKSNSNTLTAKVDPFHFENALANLIDNAIKYGGDTIEVNLTSLLNSIEITVADNGGKIDKSQREKIFDKFYRVPTGNRHDVKGFGIGLFYSKKIVEKHNGQLSLVPDTANTIFKIVL
ncbi:sensor histidine kinase [uncultured Croceitalea sp.]|uniref:sensor histidine kinase n=1 Tax=uncultured Croceitalea sp. TaxID=1798908 RepID=UPI00374F911D